MATEILVAVISGALAAYSTYMITRSQVKRDIIAARTAENDRKAEIDRHIDEKVKAYMNDLEERLAERDSQIDQLEVENTDLKRKLREADDRVVTQDLKIQTQAQEIAGLKVRIQELERRIGTGELKHGKS